MRTKLSFYTVVWGCPEGYQKLWETCVKVVKSKKKYVEAEQLCAADGAKLVRPQTYPDVSLKSMI